MSRTVKVCAEENFWSWEERMEAEIAEISRLVDQREKRRYGNC